MLPLFQNVNNVSDVFLKWSAETSIVHNVIDLQ